MGGDWDDRAASEGRTPMLSERAVKMSSSHSKLKRKSDPTPKNAHKTPGAKRPTQNTVTSSVVLVKPS